MREEVVKQIAELDKTDIQEFGKNIDEILEREHIKILDRSGLTKREKEILRLIAQNCTNREIANSLFISKRTVEIHRAHMMKKLGLKSQHDQLKEYVKNNDLNKIC